MVFVPGPIAVGGRRPSNFPWILTNDAGGEDLGAFACGGYVVVATAAATLLIGDAVFWSAAFNVNKSIVAGDRLKRAGIVVGGVQRAVEDYTAEVLQNALDVGEVAALVNQPVLVCHRGIALAIADGVIAAGAQITFSAATSGRVTAAASAAVTDAMGVVATAIDAAAANGDKIRVLVSY
jgi:hypothetical protein